MMSLFIGINFLIMICAGVVLFVSRFAILEIKAKDIELYKKILKDTDGFPEKNDSGMMGYKTQISLGKYFYKNKDNNKNIVLIHQQTFKFFVTSLVLLICVQVGIIISIITSAQ